MFFAGNGEPRGRDQCSSDDWWAPRGDSHRGLGESRRVSRCWPGVKSRKSDRPADLTGTDCLVVRASGEIAEDQCGLHTVLGEMIGRAVYTSVAKGIAGFAAS